MKTERYYQLINEQDTATLYIYGDITSWPWEESDVSSYNLSQELRQLRANGVKKVSVHVNSYGGEVAEGLAIYNELSEFEDCETVCTGFAASIASVIFMAGRRRVMRPSSLLMIHNAWTVAAGNAEELRKTAEDLDTITSASVTAYMARAKVPEEEIKALMDRESWITPDKAMELGLCDAVEEAKTEKTAVNQAYVPHWTVNADGRATDILETKPNKENPEPAEPEKPEEPEQPVNSMKKFFRKM